jgi:hypothetical protein
MGLSIKKGRPAGDMLDGGTNLQRLYAIGDVARPLGSPTTPVMKEFDARRPKQSVISMDSMQSQ